MSIAQFALDSFNQIQFLTLTALQSALCTRPTSTQLAYSYTELSLSGLVCSLIENSQSRCYYNNINKLMSTVQRSATKAAEANGVIVIDEERYFDIDTAIQHNIRHDYSLSKYVRLYLQLSLKS